MTASGRRDCFFQHGTRTLAAAILVAACGDAGDATYVDDDATYADDDATFMSNVGEAPSAPDTKEETGSFDDAEPLVRDKAVGFQTFSIPGGGFLDQQVGTTSELCVLTFVRGGFQSELHNVDLRPNATGWRLSITNQLIGSTAMDVQINCVNESSLKKGTSSPNNYPRVFAASPGCTDVSKSFSTALSTNFHALTLFGGITSSSAFVEVGEASPSGPFLFLKKGGRSPCYLLGGGVSYNYPSSTAELEFLGPLGSGAPLDVGSFRARAAGGQTALTSVGASSSTHFCFLTKLGGDLRTRNEFAGLTLLNPGVWAVTAGSGTTGSATAEARCIRRVQ